MQDFLKQIGDKLRSGKKAEIVYIRSGIEPGRDWIITLVSFAVLCLCMGAAAVYLYIKVNHGTLFTVPDNGTESALSIDANLLDKVIKHMDLQSSSIDNFRANAKSISDPSL